MHRASQFIGQKFVDQPLPDHTTLPRERSAFYGQGKMALATSARARVARVSIRIIDDLNV